MQHAQQRLRESTEQLKVISQQLWETKVYIGLPPSPSLSFYLILCELYLLFFLQVRMKAL